jgi:hypothetical protein
VPSAPGEIEKKTCLLTRKNNARLACNISAYARASKFETIIKKGKANTKKFNDRYSYKNKNWTG